MKIILKIILRAMEAIVVLALCFLCFLALNPDYFTTKEQKTAETSSETPPVRVVTRSVQFIANDRVFQATGTSVARKSVWIYSPVAEQVVAVNFTAQQKIKKGYLLIQLDAILRGAEIRLRPVMMTVLSTVVGSLPLVLSSGPGSEARSAIGWVIFGGLGLATFLTLYLTPIGYALIAPFVKPRSHAQKIQN